MGIRSEWMKVQMTELESALQNLWSDGLYKIILSNAIKKESEGAAYRKVVLNRKPMAGRRSNIRRSRYFTKI